MQLQPSFERSDVANLLLALCTESLSHDVLEPIPSGDVDPIGSGFLVPLTGPGCTSPNYV